MATDTVTPDAISNAHWWALKAELKEIHPNLRLQTGFVQYRGRNPEGGITGYDTPVPRVSAVYEARNVIASVHYVASSPRKGCMLTRSRNGVVATPGMWRMDEAGAAIFKAEQAIVRIMNAELHA